MADSSLATSQWETSLQCNAVSHWRDVNLESFLDLIVTNGILSNWIIEVSIKFYVVTTKENHDDVIKWKHFPRYWPFVRVIHRSPVNYPHKGQWRGALMFSLICAWINGWLNNREAGDLRRHRAHYDVTVMISSISIWLGNGLSPNNQRLGTSELTHWPLGNVAV